jgi:hypothetical protein
MLVQQEPICCVCGQKHDNFVTELHWKTKRLAKFSEPTCSDRECKKAYQELAVQADLEYSNYAGDYDGGSSEEQV